MIKHSDQQKGESLEEKAQREAWDQRTYQRSMMPIPQRMDLIEDKLTRIERMVEKLLKATEE